MKKFLWVSIITIFAVGCTEDIDIPLDTTFDRLVVEGYLNTDTAAHQVRLTKSSDYYSGTKPTPVTQAMVRLNNGEEEIVLDENPVIAGLYETDSGYFGEIGRTYQLDIELQEEIGGFKNFSATSEIKPIGTIDSIQVVYNETWDVFEVRIFAWEPPTTDFYMFEVLKNNVLMTDTLNKKWISDDRFFNGNYTYGVMVGILNNENPWEVVKPGDTVTLKMSSITEDYYRFVFELQDQTFQFRNPLFSGPPANVRTNIPNAHGFFATYSSVYSSTIYQEE
jgi:hypothetical protein